MGWMHSCQRASALLSRSHDEALGAIDTLRLRIHLQLCGNCRNVELQVVQLEALTAEFLQGGAATGPEPGPKRP